MAARSTTASTSDARFDAVVVGGSAGALEVLRQILRTMPATTAVPVVVVLHLPPRPPEGLPELLARDCLLAVQQAEDKEPLQPGVVYLAPPGYHLLIESHRAFALSVDDPVHFSRPSIDVLFQSARDTYGGRLLAMLLSGASADGAAGLHEVAAVGGITIVQSPAASEAAAMPSAALALFKPTYVWTPAEMTKELPSLFAVRSSMLGSPA
ncbi:two-component system chemotaxis response regulator CheB [Povalibacter uvarum]|uniref:protein-glutamate methylesterase n=1 Tax=Povalibacter uvarum TaxID=732238 RepID=A0A841HTB2_9GAMM|nr:chemotaxis protein CheB [Povalibacter uvarum]MBB6095232.1 two-component system chemotaxis response regulator CheB [Povalibacter uvarum]